MSGRATSHIEEEARFLIRDTVVWKQAATLRSVAGFSLRARGRERQRNTYFDTAGLRLRRAGAVLKLRVIGEHSTLMLKQRLGYREHVARHREVAVRLRTTSPASALRQLPKSVPGRQALRLAGGRPLRVLLTLETDRRRLVIGKGRAQIELDADDVALRVGQRILGRRRELEVENLTASAAVYHDVLHTVRRFFGAVLRPSRVSKFEFGLRALRASRRARSRS